MKTLSYLAGLLLFILNNSVLAQTDKATTKKIIEAKSYTFIATSATPLGFMDVANVLNKLPGATPTGGVIQLTGTQYAIKVTPDTVMAHLPFYGRAFRANQTTSDSGGFKFTVTQFEYKSKPEKKGNWIININTKDEKDSYRMILNVGTSGYAILSVNSNNRQNITYNGYLKENDTK